MTISVSEIEKALASLELALNEPLDEFVRDACIQRFEYTFELAWKLAKRALEYQGIISVSPRTVFRDCGQQGLISDVELWLRFLDDRNLTTHTYNEKTAHDVYETAKEFAQECRKLILKVKTLTKK